MRANNLVATATNYQFHVHPRGPWSYGEDVDVLVNLESVYVAYPAATVTSVQVSVGGVVSDTLLSTASWVRGSHKGGFDFYDACVVMLNIKGAEIIIPSARVLSASRPKVEKDPEQGDGYERPQGEVRI